MPAVVVEVDGAPLAEQGLRELAEVRVRQRLSAPAQCELSFHGPVETRLPEPGAGLRVAVAGVETPLFTGQITAAEHVFGADGHHEVRLRAYDALHRLRKTQHVRAMAQTTVEGLARELAGELGLSVEAAAAGPLWENIVQHRENDFELLVLLAERCGLYPVLQGDVLHLLTLEGNGHVVALRLEEELLEARVELNGDRACRSVTAMGWDPLRAVVHDAAARSPRLGRATPAEVPPESVDGTGEVTLLDEYASDAEHALALAQAELDVRAAAEVTLWGVAEGDARLQPGVQVDVSGLHGGVDGRYVLTDVVHVIDETRGFLTEISTAPPQVRRRRTASVAALGEVTDVDDPEGRGRVRVRFPAYGDVESDWLGVVVPGAGPDKGLVALPDVSDRVLVLFAHEDPAAGVVVGGLYGTEAPPDPGVADAATKRYTLRTPSGNVAVLDDENTLIRVATPGGQAIALEDEGSLIRLEDSTGSSVVMTPERVSIHAAVDLTIEAPGRAILVRANSVDFERAT